jgi:thiosulfate reductase/polysulfide reductase chain A
MKTNRRDFLRITSLTAAGVVLGGTAAHKVFASGEYKNRMKRHKTATYCEVCFWKCAGWVYTDEQGEVWKVTGNELDPMCRGRLCPRGTGGVGMYHDPDRLKTPLIRKTENGKQVFREASWEEALTVIAAKMKALRDESGPESIALFNHGSGGKHFTTLLNAFGSENATAPSYAQCRGPREVGFELTFGKALDSPEPIDIENARCLVLIGSHIGENMHNSHIQEMSALIDKKAVIITVDPRLSTAAAHSTHWLPIKPATDIALLLAWMNVLITEELYDRKYVDKYCKGFPELAEYIRDKTPEWASSVTGLSAEQIRSTAFIMASSAPATLIHPGRHVTWYGDDTQRTRCIAILTALLGAYGKKGGYYIPQSVGLPGFPHPPFPKPSWSWKELITERYLFARSSVSNTFVDISHPDNKSDKKIRGWLVVGTNLIQTVPDQKRTLEAIDNLDLLVVVDTMPSEITGYADVVLPECTYIERSDHPRVTPGKKPTIALRTAAVEPKYLSKPASWIAKKLSLKLGLQDYFQYDDFEEVVKYQLENAGISYFDLIHKGVHTVELPEENCYISDDQEYVFGTPSGKIELYSDLLKDAGFDPLPVYTPHPEPAEGYYRLNYGRAPMHTFSRTANNPNLSALMASNDLWINPEVAEKHGITDGQEIWLKNQDEVISDFPIKVRLTERMNKASVYMVHGFGLNDRRLSKAFGKGISDTQLITKVMVDPIMGGTGMRGNFVTFLLTNPAKEAQQ